METTTQTTLQQLKAKLMDVTCLIVMYEDKKRNLFNAYTTEEKGSPEGEDLFEAIRNLNSAWGHLADAYEDLEAAETYLNRV